MMLSFGKVDASSNVHDMVVISIIDYLFLVSMDTGTRRLYLDSEYFFSSCVS